MNDESSTITYVVREPFQQALRSLRAVLADQGMRIGGELNISDRIRQALLIGTAPCVLVLVWPAGALGQILRSDSVATATVPLHVVVSGRGSRSEVHILRSLPTEAQAMERRAVSA